LHAATGPVAGAVDAVEAAGPGMGLERGDVERLALRPRDPRHHARLRLTPHLHGLVRRAIGMRARVAEARMAVLAARTVHQPARESRAGRALIAVGAEVVPPPPTRRPPPR